LFLVDNKEKITTRKWFRVDLTGVAVER